MYWAQLAVAGMFAGAVYALFGLGITLVYKSTRVPNFAHGAVGTVGAFLFYKAWGAARHQLQVPFLHLQVPFTKWSWNPVLPRLPLPLALLLALVATGLIGLAIERVFMRHLVNAPTLSLIVATVGLFLLIVGLAVDLFNQKGEQIAAQVVPQHRYIVGGIRFFADDVTVAVIAIGLAVLFGAFFKFTNLGIAIRATADSRETSRLLGINANRVAAFSWAVGSMLATLAGILIVSRNNGTLDYGTLLLLILPGFTAAMFGGFTSLVGTFVGGVVLGVAQSLFVGIDWPTHFLKNAFSTAGAPQFVSFLVVVAVLMTRPKFIFKGVRVDEESGVAFVRAGSGLNLEDRVRRNLDRRQSLQLLLADWSVGRWVLAAMATIGILAIPVFAVSYWSTVLGSAVFTALIVLSIVVLTGWTGQISLAALGFAGAGSFGAASLSTSAHLPFWLTIPLAGLVGVPLAVLVGVPALRLRGFFLALATMAFMVACESWLFTQSFFSTHNDVSRGVLRDDVSQPAFYASLFFAVIVFVGVRNLGRTRVARAFHALRDSENTAISMGIDPVRYKLLAFALSGFIAGVAGGCWGYMNLKVVPGAFTFQGSLQFITYTVIAGIALQAGAVAAPVLFVLLPTIAANTASGVNNFPFFIFPGYVAVRTVIDYPNGVGGFLSRVLRPFDRSEQVAWASAEADSDERQVIDLRDEETEDRLYEEAAHTGLVGASGV